MSGTSNSLIAKGINAAFSTSPAVTSFTNQTYGASGTVAIGDHLRNIDFAKHDFCVLDYWVNESVFIWQKESTTESAVNSISAMIDAASIAGCKPIAIIFPDEKRLNAERPFEDAVKDIFRSRGIPVFDSYKFAERIMAASNFSYEELFLNPMHIRREIGKFMGDIAIKYMQTDLGRAKPQISKTELTYQPLGFLSHKDVRIEGIAELVQRETRLLKTEVLRIEPGARIHLSVDGPVEVIGLTCNAARSIGEFRDGRTGARFTWRTRGPWVLIAGTTTLTNRRHFITLGEGQGKPDGATTDVEGNYLIAGIYAGAVHSFTPAGKHLQTVTIPAEMVTMPCFGGADLKTVFVISLMRPKDGVASDGGLFSYQSDTAGPKPRRMSL